jgi:LacI family transcriptional regulator
MPAPNPTTQRDVADACGFHPSTVCLALKNSPSIPLATRRRVQSIAEKLGYQPNVAARNLALLRTERKGAGSLPIAWINQESRREHWRLDPAARTHFEAAQRRAGECGYHLEEVWTRETGMSVARIVQIIRARGIEGVIFPAHRSFDFSLLNQGWSDFAMVGFNDHRLAEWIDVVAPDYYRNLDTALRRLRHCGFERPGLVIRSHFDAASQGLAHSGFLRFQSELRTEDRLPVCFIGASAASAAEVVPDWCREHRPDVVIGSDRESLRGLNCGERKTACVQLQGLSEGVDAGIDPGMAEIAIATVDCLVEKMRRFEKGVREPTRLHLIKGTWEDRGLMRREAETSVA